ncbi:Serine/threonine/tyrosine-interacting protein [Colletotrichum chlorophyti]|uniref:Serine/threonine/tyrosine-interacting protein n=1 Tax=Colletotrichum chlorophyti TaxID=708187 RepID=A0A1Q8S849_9PEZI|nr:Serine/threonine/tyrosine-interacting protein [Colletotrichum chlorophyti]
MDIANEGVSDAIATAPYSHRAPSPPYIPIPMTFPKGSDSCIVMPALNFADFVGLTKEEYSIITRLKAQKAVDRTLQWTYEARRKAQSVLDYLYLGPLSVARDQAWLSNEGITMIIVARHSRVAQARLMSVDKVAQSLGIVVEYVDVADNGELIHGLPNVVRKINKHMLDVYRNQARSGLSWQESRFGKVLLVCETGNDRSAFVAAAYVMSMFEKDMVSAVQFIAIQRFSANFDEDGKRMLQSYEDILNAQKDVSEANGDGHRAGSGFRNHGGRDKRGIEDTLDEDERQASNGHSMFATDRERFLGRSDFVPFIDPDVDHQQPI